jgi:hypothetical protein
MGKARLLLVFLVAFACGFAFRAGVNALKVTQFGNQRFREGHTAGVEQVRAEAVREGHASYMDRNSDQVSEFIWNVGRPDWTGGGENMGATELPAVVVSLIQ